MALFVFAQISDLPGRPAGRLYLVKGPALVRCKQDNSTRTPRPSPSVSRHITKDLDQISLNINPLQLGASKEPYQAAVRRPEGKGALFSSRKNSSFSCVIQAA